MKLIWNPWKRIKELEQDVDYLVCDIDNAYAEMQGLVDALDEISKVAKPSSNATVRRMSNMAQDAVDKYYGFELTEK
jgi:ribonuclease HI